MNNPRYASLLRTLYGAILTSRLSTTELKALVNELRRGQLADELAYMLDRDLSHFENISDFDSVPDGRLVEAELLIKRRRTSKAALSNMMASLGFNAPSGYSIRDILAQFFASSNQGKASKFLDMLGSKQLDDEYLTGISDRKR